MWEHSMFSDMEWEPGYHRDGGGLLVYRHGGREKQRKKEGPARLFPIRRFNPLPPFQKRGYFWICGKRHTAGREWNRFARREGQLSSGRNELIANENCFRTSTQVAITRLTRSWPRLGATQRKIERSCEPSYSFNLGAVTLWRTLCPVATAW